MESQSNLIYGVIYSHPNSNLNNFMTDINWTTEQIHSQEKYTFITGDFNINLLDSCQFSEDFINTLGSLFFQPHILQNNQSHINALLLVEELHKL